MKFSAQITMVGAALFAFLCLGYAAYGFMSLGELTDEKMISDARGFAFFWAFLGAIGLAFAAVSWWIAKTEKGDRL